ncbi:hypothetical protein, partial [Microbacterium sp.]|uniref:hypothetical protein n=1 Tax=Microbacterium sp. TaxID=51671 RepID=UPI002E321B32
EADVDLLWEYDVDTVALECPGNDEDTADSPYTGAWCGFTGGGKTHGCCFGAQCVGPGNSSGTRPGSCCYCILPNGNCGTQPACETQTPKWDCVLGSLAVRLSPWCSQCGGEYGHDAGPDEICKTEDDVY